MYGIGDPESGARFTKIEHFNKQCLMSYMSDGNDKFILTYNHDKRFFTNSEDFIGDIKTYPSTYPKSGPCVYVEKGDIFNEVNQKLKNY